MIDNITGPDPRESDPTRFDATLTMTITIKYDITTSNVTADNDHVHYLDLLLKPLENLGATVDVQTSHIEAK